MLPRRDQISEIYIMACKAPFQILHFPPVVLCVYVNSSVSICQTPFLWVGGRWNSSSRERKFHILTLLLIPHPLSNARLVPTAHPLHRFVLFGTLHFFAQRKFMQTEGTGSVAGSRGSVRGGKGFIEGLETFWVRGTGLDAVGG